MVVQFYKKVKRDIFRYMIIVAMVGLSIVFNSEAARWEENYVHDKTGCHYCALCFSKEEADDFKGKLDAISLGVGGIGGIGGSVTAVTKLISVACPAVIPVAAIVAGVICSSAQLVKGIICWNTSKGTGFSINIPSKNIFRDKYQDEKGWMGFPLVPFIWESN